MALDIEVLLGPERSSGRDLDDAHAILGNPEERGDLAAVVPDALALRIDIQRTVSVGHDERGLGLEEGVLDELGTERLRDHVRSSGEGFVDVASLHARDREDVPALVQLRGLGRKRLERVGHRLEHLVLHLHEGGRSAGGMAVLGRDGGDDVADVRRDLALGHELAPVPLDRSLCALAGDVGGGDDRYDSRLRERPRRVDAEDPGPRVIREPQPAVEHAGGDHVAHERVVAEGQLRALVAGGARADAAAAVGLRQGLPAAGTSGELDRVDDLDVAGAAAQVPEQGMGDLVPRGLWMLLQEHLGLHHDSG